MNGNGNVGVAVDSPQWREVARCRQRALGLEEQLREVRGRLAPLLNEHEQAAAAAAAAREDGDAVGYRKAAVDAENATIRMHPVAERLAALELELRAARLGVERAEADAVLADLRAEVDAAARRVDAAKRAMDEAERAAATAMGQLQAAQYTFQAAQGRWHERDWRAVAQMGRGAG